MAGDVAIAFARNWSKYCRKFGIKAELQDEALDEALTLIAPKPQRSDNDVILDFLLQVTEIAKNLPPGAPFPNVHQTAREHGLTLSRSDTKRVNRELRDNELLEYVAGQPGGFRKRITHANGGATASVGGTSD